MMSRILDNLPLLQDVIRSQPLGVIVDIDGTISPPSTDPLHIKIPENNLGYLAVLVSRIALVAVISGREARDVKELVNIDGVEYIGHYGMEEWQGNHALLHPDARQYVPAVRAIAKELASLRALQGIIIQDKWASISIHYRLSTQPAEAKARILAVLDRSTNMNGLRVIEENMVVGIVPPLDIDKGTAVSGLIRKHPLHSALYIGDDVADIPAFNAIHEANRQGGFKGLSIAVTSRVTIPEVITAADFILNGVKETALLLQWLADNTRA